jgi:cytochrome c556
MSIRITRAGAACATIVTMTLGLAACSQNPAPPPAAAAAPQVPFQPDASIQDLMQNVVDHNADILWESVAVISSEKGIEEHMPRTDEDWATVRAAAVTLSEATNLLMIPGRKVAHEGKVLQDSQVEGILKAEQIQALIDADHSKFASKAMALHAAALAALQAIDAKDHNKLSDVGGAIDEACEQCHTTYWYPDQQKPAEPTATANTQ